MVVNMHQTIDICTTQRHIYIPATPCKQNLNLTSDQRRIYIYINDIKYTIFFPNHTGHYNFYELTGVFVYKRVKYVRLN